MIQLEFREASRLFVGYYSELQRKKIGIFKLVDKVKSRKFTYSLEARILLAAACAFYLPLSYIASIRLSKSDSALVLPYRAPKPNLPKPVHEVVSLGYWPLLVDSLWTRVLLDPSIEKVQLGDHAPIFFDILSSSDLDPAFFDLHFFGGNYLSIVRGDHEGARIILNRALEFQNTKRNKLPKKFADNFWFAPHSMSIAAGYLNMFELENFPEAERIFEEASKYPNAPPYLKDLAARLRNPVMAVALGVQVTETLLKRINSDEKKRILLERLRDLEVAGFVFKLRADWTNALRTQKWPVLKQFLSSRGLTTTDPWGGKLYLNEKNQIETTTPRKKVYGL